MSYQAITDIIVNQSQTQDFLLSATVKDSPKSNSSASFAEILASFNEEKSTDSVNETRPEKSDEAKKTDAIEKEDDKAENQVEKEKSPEKASEDKIEKSDSKSVNKEKDSEKLDDKNKITKKSLNAEPAEARKLPADGKTVKAADDKDAKNVKNQKNKKLSEKDFARLDEIADKAQTVNEAAKFAGQNANKQIESDERKEKAEENNSSEIAVNADTTSELSMNQLGGDNKADTSDFNFSGGEEKSKKTFALDKEGKITVEDQRTKIEVKSDNENLDAKKPAIKTSEIKLTNDSTAVMTVEVNPDAQADVLSLNTQTAASNGSNFQAMLNNQLHNVAPEFVKAGNLVLKDNNQGTINLVLHPDDLGNVKIHLSLDGKTLSGHITVATKEALQVFKDNAETLREAFIKSGFDSASFDVAMNNGGSFNQSMGFERGDDGSNLFAKRAYGNTAGGLSAELESILDNAEDISNYSVNIVA